MEVCLLDVETTGLNPLNDRICEIAMYCIDDDGGVLDRFVSLVNPGIPIPDVVYKIHKISDAMVRFSPTFEEIAREVYVRMEGRVVVAYNLDFDIGFLIEEFRRAKLEMPWCIGVDALVMVKEAATCPSYRLGSVAQYFGLSVGNLHRAEADVCLLYDVLTYITRVVLKRQLKDWIREAMSRYGKGFGRA